MTASARRKSSRETDIGAGRIRSNKIDMANKAGRKSLYDKLVFPRLDEIREAASNGVNEETIRKDLRIPSTSWYDYKKKHEELAEALESGRARAIIRTKSALMKAAEGFWYNEEKQYQRKNKKGVDVGGVEITKKYCAPNPTAIAMILRNLDEDFTDRDSATMDLKKQEAELKKKLAEMQMIDFEGV